MTDRPDRTDPIMDHHLATRLRQLATELAALADRTRTDHPSSDDATAVAVTLAERFTELADRGDLDALDAIVHHDVTYVVSGRGPAAGVYEGIDAMRAALSVPLRHGVTDVRTKLIDLVARPDLVTTFHELIGTIDGHERRFEFALRFHVRDAKIAAIAEFSADQHTSDTLFAAP